MKAAANGALSDGGLRRRLTLNLAWIGSSQGVITVLGLISLALTARALGPVGLGMLAFIEAYSRTIARIFHPEPWQALIQYGTIALEDGDTDRFARLVWLSLMVDLMGGALSAIIGVGLTFLISAWMPLIQGQEALLGVAVASTFLAPRPTALGLLRIYDRFDLLARSDMAIALVRLALVALAWAAGLGLPWFVALFVIWTLADGIVPAVLALQELRRRGQGMSPARVSPVLRQNPGLFRLFVNSNVNVVLRQLRHRLDIILLAGVLPAEGLGLYQLARRIGDAALRIGRPVTQVLSPEFARLAARRNYRVLRRLMLGGSVGLGLVLLALLLPIALYMKTILVVIFGPDFAGAHASVIIMAAAMAVYMASMSLGPALISLGRDQAMIVITMLSTLIFFAALMPAAHIWGAEGAAAAHLLANVIWLAGSIVVAWRMLRHLAEAFR